MKEDFGPTSLEYEDALGQFAGMEGMGMGGAGGMGVGGDEQEVRSLIPSTTFLDIC